MKTSTKANETSYIEVALSDLKVGTVIDRPLFVHLQKNGRHVCLLQEFHLLTQKVYDKLSQFGKIYTDREPGLARYKEAIDYASELKKICDEEHYTHYERNDLVFKTLKPFLEKVFKDTSTREWDPTATESGLVVVEPVDVVYFFLFGLQIPDAQILENFEDADFAGFAGCLQTASVASLFALILGYTDLKYISQYFTAVYLENVAESLKKEQAENIRKKIDDRFQRLLFHVENKIAVEKKIGLYNDDLQDLGHYTKWLMLKSNSVFNPTVNQEKIKEIPNSRVYKKVRTQLARVFSVSQQGQVKGAAA